MPVLISGVEKNSPAFRGGILAGETLLMINQHPIQDVLDYRFYMMNTTLTLTLEREGKQRELPIQKGEYDDIGLLFDTYLMDSQRSCRNNCIFCFIDQMPPGLRESLYFKDDDARMSFFYGNYITLTNLTEHDIVRTIAMKISPINVSVHTTNPELRCKMMNNRFAGDALQILSRFAEAGIAMNAQLVLCPGINDGAELERSLTDLSKLIPSLQTVSCVPVGLTKYRDGLTKLRAYTKEEAEVVIAIIHRFADRQQKETGERIFYPADEFFIKAEQEIPPAAYYGNFNQLENGVGMIAYQEEQFLESLTEFAPDNLPRTLSIATGTAAAPYLQALVKKAAERWQGLACTVYPVTNHFFGEQITVSGLITGSDLIEQLKGKKLGKHLLIPANMLRFEGDLFLDDLSITDVQNALGVPVIPVPFDGYTLLEFMLQTKTES